MFCEGSSSSSKALKDFDRSTIKLYSSYRFLNLSGFKASGTNLDFFVFAINNGFNILKVRIPNFVCFRGSSCPLTGVYVSDAVTELRSFATNFTNF